MGRQVQAPRPRVLGKSAAEGPNDRLADLIHFSQNTRGKTKYGLVVMDVFTREAAVEPLQNKNAETGPRHQARRAGADRGRLWSRQTWATSSPRWTKLPEAVRRTKRPEDRNAIAVVDRGIQTLKKDLATRVARKGGQSEFRVLQDNADKFQHNKDLTDRRVKAVEDSSWAPWTMTVRSTEGRETLLKLALPAPQRRAG